jgi:hypothetical protein
VYYRGSDVVLGYMSSTGLHMYNSSTGVQVYINSTEV